MVREERGEGRRERWLIWSRVVRFVHSRHTDYIQEKNLGGPVQFSRVKCFGGSHF